jgi:hypothetical protein
MEDHQRPLAAPLSRETATRSRSVTPQAQAAARAGDLGEHALQVGAGEGPVEQSGDLAVVLAEAQQPIGELIKRVEAVRAERLALDDREVELDLVEPGLGSTRSNRLAWWTSLAAR